MTTCSCSGCSCNQPRSFWVELDEAGNPSSICWAYYPDDKPMVGNWIKVTEGKKT